MLFRLVWFARQRLEAEGYGEKLKLFENEQEKSKP